MSQSSLPSLSSIKQDIQEAIVKPVADQAGQAFEQGVAMVSTQSIAPAVDDKAKQDDPTKAAQTAEQKIIDDNQKRNISSFFQQMTVEEQQLRQKRQQEQMDKKQEDAEETQVKKIKVADDSRKRQMNTAVYRAQRSEIKKNGE